MKLGLQQSEAKSLTTVHSWTRHFKPNYTTKKTTKIRQPEFLTHRQFSIFQVFDHIQILQRFSVTKQQHKSLNQPCQESTALSKYYKFSELNRLRWPNTVFLRALADIQHVHNDCNNKHAYSDQFLCSMPALSLLFFFVINAVC